MTFVNSYKRAIVLIVGSAVIGTGGSVPLLVYYGKKTLTLHLWHLNSSEQSNVTGLLQEYQNYQNTTSAVTVFNETTTWRDGSVHEDRPLADVYICHYSDAYDGTLSQVLEVFPN